MANFKIQQIAERVFSILDEGQASFYVVEGTDRAAVVDTGITRGEKIIPIIRQITQKPLVLAVTHAHLDHMFHADEFETIYMSRRELTVESDVLEHMTGGKRNFLEKAIDIWTDSVIDLGDNSLEVCGVPGHTPGTVVFLEKKNNLLFTGDAIGSGYGVWLQVLGAVPLATYYESLICLQKWLVDRGGRMLFFGGHNAQQFESRLIPGYNPLGMGILGDLIDLVDGVLKGTIVGRPSPTGVPFSTKTNLYASYGRAEMEYLPDHLF